MPGVERSRGSAAEIRRREGRVKAVLVPTRDITEGKRVIGGAVGIDLVVVNGLFAQGLKDRQVKVIARKTLPEATDALLIDLVVADGDQSDDVAVFSRGEVKAVLAGSSASSRERAERRRAAGAVGAARLGS